MNVINITAEPREAFGGQNSSKLRNEGKIPCVLYGGQEVKHFILNAAEIKPFVYTADFNIIEINLEGTAYRTVLKDIQFHPVTEVVEHMDFHELVPGRKVKVSVPVKLVGDSAGVKEGGSLVTVMRKLHIKATPENLVAELVGDISHLNLSQSIYVRDMNVPEGIEVLQEMGSPVGYIEVPRSLKSLESSAVKAGVEEEEGDDAAEGGEESEGETAAE
jgi:large subunit ribosomal protein L25